MVDSSPAVPVSPLEFQHLTESIVGQRVSRPWSATGSVLFAEVGKLRHAAQIRLGIYRLGFGYDWRVEGPSYIAFESSAPRMQLRRDIKALQGLRIEGIALVGNVPELIIRLTSDLTVWTLSREGSPTWSVRLADNSWLGVTEGLLVRRMASG